MSDEKKSSGGKWKFITLLILILIVVIVYFIFNFTYSEGNRAGVLTKFSKKGFVFKTYEGELNINGLGNISNTAIGDKSWPFSVTDEATADTLAHLEGRRVSLHYREILKNMPWQGETKYYVDGVQVISQ